MKKTPAQPDEIKVRRMDLEFPRSLPTFWYDDNPLLTATLAALAVAFPAGERYFIDSVRHFLPQLKDPALRKAVRLFVGQESNHTKEHIAFNEFLEAKGYPAHRMAAWVEKRIKHIQNSSTPEANLARTAALEHFTAILAGTLVEHPEVAERMGAEPTKLWMWHAVEELEHRAVAFDVYKATVDDEALRLRTMAKVTAIFITLNVIRAGMILRAHRKLGDWRSHLKGLDTLWVRPGLFRKVIPAYLAYYRRDFHPSEIDHADAVERAKRVYLGEQA